ncbi:MAG: urease accessory protein UreF [Geminicoccaceae bacterium]
MTDRELCRLMAWFSPAFPIGAYAYSHGLETAVASGLVRSGDELTTWLEDLLRYGSGFSDALFLGRAWHMVLAGEEATIATLSERAIAFQPTAELRLETAQQGRAFLTATAKAWPCPALTRLQASSLPALPYPIAVGVACAGHGLGLRPALVGYLLAFATNLTSAGVRLVPLGQSDGLDVLARLEPVVEAVTEAALAGDLGDLASAVPMVDYCSMRHETDYTRLFRS